MPLRNNKAPEIRFITPTTLVIGNHAAVKTSGPTELTSFGVKDSDQAYTMMTTLMKNYSLAESKRWHVWHQNIQTSVAFRGGRRYHVVTNITFSGFKNSIGTEDSGTLSTIFCWSGIPFLRAIVNIAIKGARPGDIPRLAGNREIQLEKPKIV